MAKEQVRLDIYKVLHVTPFFPPEVGGIPNHVFNLCSILAKKGNQINVAVPRRVFHRTKRVKPKEIYDLFQIASIYLLGWPYPTLRSVSFPVDLGRKIDSVIRKDNYDLVHIHGIHYPFSWIAINSAHKHGVPSVLTMHCTYALNPVFTGKSLIEDWMYKLLFVKLIAKTDAVIGTTNNMTNFTRQLAAQSTNYFTIPNGINTQIYKENLGRKSEYRIKYDIREDALVVLFRGRFEQVKGIIEFSHAIRKIMKRDRNNIEVVVVGEGSLKSEVHSILRNVPGVHIFGWQPPEEVHELFIAADVFVIPSKIESQGITVLEAMNASLHIVYTPVGGVPETLQGYFSKTMLNDSSSEEIERALTDLFEAQATTPNIPSSLAYARTFDWERITSEVSKVYSEVISKT